MTTAVKTEVEEEKKYVSLYVKKSVADELNKLKDGEGLEEELIAYVTSTRKEFRDEITCFDEDVLRYKAQIARAKQALREAYDEYRDVNYKLWEDTQKDIKSSSDYAKAAVAVLAPLKKELEDLNSLMKSIRDWDIERLIKLLNQLQDSDAGAKEMLKFLFENFRRAE